MRVLDLDLDLFLSDVAYNCETGHRLDDDDYTPWSQQRVRQFLESACQLSTVHPIPGRIVTNHDEAFYFWRELIANAILSAPFDVVHADAHADLGLGDTSYVYIMEELLAKDIANRCSPRTGRAGLNLGS